jgi:UDP-N-acetylglucosamine 2-epimerase (non-hydrolysing)
MKIAPLVEEMKSYPDIEQILIHTGQHYDHSMSRVFLDELDIPYPDFYLGIGSGSHGAQTAKVMLAFEPLVSDKKPDVVLVVGDVNSTLACALVATKMHVPVAHVEAGLRSFDWKMPEEINRVLTDQLADLLFTTERDGNENLRQEGIAEEKIHFVGNVMIDTLLRHRDRAVDLDVFAQFGFSSKRYALLTMHRPSNVDVKDVLKGILDAIGEIQKKLPLIFSAHPRTVERIREFGLNDRLWGMSNLRLVEPLGYLEFLNLMSNARLVLTDSGGIQEETTILGVPCLTLRKNTERPVTVSEGTNLVVGTDPDRIVEETRRVLSNDSSEKGVPELWDGQAAKRIIRIVYRMFGG